MRSSLIAFAILAPIGLQACQTASQHVAQVSQSVDDKMTLGTVQRQIRIGMTNAEVVGVLGAPNMVTTDEKRREQWVYDKISTESVYSSSAGGVGVLFLGGVSGHAGASSTSQRSLTVIVKFDEGGLVRDFAYRSSSF